MNKKKITSKNIFIAGYSTLSPSEKKKANKLIEKLKSQGHKITKDSN